MSSALLILFIVGLLGSQTEGIRIWYAVLNYITNDDQVFFAIRPVKTTEKPFVEIMRDVAEIDDRYNFTGIDFGGDLGIFVTSINGVFQDVDKEIAWAILKKIGKTGKTGSGLSGFCSLPVGVSTFVPKNKDKILFVLEDWDIHNRLPTCDDGPPHDSVK